MRIQEDVFNRKASSYLENSLRGLDYLFLPALH